MDSSPLRHDRHIPIHARNGERGGGSAQSSVPVFCFEALFKFQQRQLVDVWAN